MISVSAEQGHRNKGDKGAAALLIYLNYSSKGQLLPYKYFRILSVYHTNETLLRPCNRKFFKKINFEQGIGSCYDMHSPIFPSLYNLS